MSLFCFPAPSTVSIMHQVSRTIESITLSWSQPDQPNGVILDYELQYYEKVPHKHTWVMCKALNHVASFNLFKHALLILNFMRVTYKCIR